MIKTRKYMLTFLQFVPFEVELGPRSTDAKADTEAAHWVKDYIKDNNVKFSQMYCFPQKFMSEGPLEKGWGSDLDFDIGDDK